MKTKQEKLALDMLKTASHYLKGETYSIEIGILKNPNGEKDGYEVIYTFGINKNEFVYTEVFETQKDEKGMEVFCFDEFDIDELQNRIDEVFETKKEMR